jgi:hexokinase
MTSRKAGKLFSGKYLGELTRLVLVKLAEEGLMFGGKIPSQLLRPGSFPTRFVSLVEQYAKHFLKTCKFAVFLE